MPVRAARRLSERMGWVRLNTKEKEDTFDVTVSCQEQPAVGAHCGASAVLPTWGSSPET